MHFLASRADRPLDAAATERAWRYGNAKVRAYDRDRRVGCSKYIADHEYIDTLVAGPSGCSWRRGRTCETAGAR